jgi:sigma-B regulation protein RsbU (phosphoserine phosphatase)
MLIIGAISSQICWLYLRRQFVHPLQQITSEATRFAREKHMSETSLTEQIRTGTEIGRLAENIDRMEKQTEDHVRAIRELTLDTERVERELELGAAIQSATLLSGLEAVKGRDEFEISAYMDPAREVGGDFYDYFFVDEDHLAVLIADVSGKGMPAALYMMTCKIGLKTVISRGGTPAERLAMFNDLLCEENIADMFVSVWLGIIEISTGKMTAANAGHEYPIFRRRGEEQDMFALYKDKHGLVLGAMEGVRYRNYEVDLKPGDFLFVYTDGVAEANNADHELFGTERTCMALNRDPDCGPDGLIANVREEINRFVKDEPQFDDITMLCLQWKGSGKIYERAE